MEMMFITLCDFLLKKYRNAIKTGNLKFIAVKLILYGRITDRLT
jgi:hypothetical protein